MNRTDIEWTEFTSNPIRGKCPHYGTSACGSYCYAERMRRSKAYQSSQGGDDGLRFVSDELEAIRNRKKPATIFMGSMIDIWASAIPDEWLRKIYLTALESRQHKIIFCTKNPNRYYSVINYRNGIWLGASVPDANKTAAFCDALAILRVEGARTFLSAEPLMEPIAAYLDPDAYEGIIIGAMTGPNAVRPERKWIMDIIEASQGKHIFIKDNLFALYPDLPGLRETGWDALKTCETQQGVLKLGA